MATHLCQLYHSIYNVHAAFGTTNVTVYRLVIKNLRHLLQKAPEYYGMLNAYPLFG